MPRARTIWLDVVKDADGERMTVPGSGPQTGLPGGASLAPGEAVLVGERFMFSTVAFYLHTDLVLTNRRLYAVRPNTLFGLIPVGTARSNFPIENIAGVNAGTRFDVLGVVFGAVGILFGLGALQIPGAALLGLLLLVLGVATFIGAPKQAIEVMNSGGGLIRFPVSVFERGRTLEFAGRVSEAIARPTRGAIAPDVTTAANPSHADPGTALLDLERLREQGLITDSEYAAKRGEILTRL
jgi:hypothetical protein